jgi:hypothetical protein
MSTGRFSSADYDLARFAVFAWIDETILSSNWEGKSRWLGEQLQRRFYNTADAGKLFFERLNTIGPHQLDVREIYYLCLAMGFTGQYCNDGDEYLLEQLKLSNLKLLTGSSMGLPDLKRATLFPDAYAPDSAPVPAVGPKMKRFSAFDPDLRRCAGAAFWGAVSGVPVHSGQYRTIPYQYGALNEIVDHEDTQGLSLLAADRAGAAADFRMWC